MDKREKDKVRKFQSTPSVGRATKSNGIQSVTSGFQSTPSVGRATFGTTGMKQQQKIFQSTPSVGRATRHSFKLRLKVGAISIHALRGEGDAVEVSNIETEAISIHALRGEGDCHARHYRVDGRHFNPRPPWGGRHIARTVRAARPPFQSTPSVGRATSKLNIPPSSLSFQSTPSVGRATHALARYPVFDIISIHALRGEGDRSFSGCGKCHVDISIHALRGEGDSKNPEFRAFCLSISIHALRGEGDYTLDKEDDPFDISIHALRGEGDGIKPNQINDYEKDFNPRPPWGGRPSQSSGSSASKYFNPRPPWGGRQCSHRLASPPQIISIHALRGEGDACR